jgi:hypothetical protein
MANANITSGSFFLPSGQSVHGVLKYSPADFIVQEITVDQRILRGQDINFHPTSIPTIIWKKNPEVSSREDKEEDKEQERVQQEDLIISEIELIKLNEYQKLGEKGMNQFLPSLPLRPFFH